MHGSISETEAPDMFVKAAEEFVVITGTYDAALRACVVRLETKGSGAAIFYTTDGSEPAMQSGRYDSALTFNRPVQLTARAFRRGIGSETPARIEIRPSLSTGKPLQLAHPFSPRYAAGGAGALVGGRWRAVGI